MSTEHEERERVIDRALDAVLRASGSELKHYSYPSTLADMRAVMSRVFEVAGERAIEKYKAEQEARQLAEIGVCREDLL